MIGSNIRIMDDWKQYQEDAAQFFRSLGLDAQTDVRLRGVRTHHDIDVVVRSNHAGFDVLWVVECKCWQTRVSKLHVLALREIVADLGSDRGILLSEAGFQRGAVEAAMLTNVRPTSIATLRQNASEDILRVRMLELCDRTESCKKQYWDISKTDRITRGLRPEVGSVGYHGALVIDYVERVLAKALRGIYPFDYDELSPSWIQGATLRFERADDVLRLLEPIIADLQQRLRI